jgi:3-phosphoshikimate 1-carboxyvinyltransferase
MAFTIASMLTEQSIVNGVDSVDVSYPQFVSEMRRLGANIRPVS